MRALSKLAVPAMLSCLFGLSSFAEPAEDVLGTHLLDEALLARDAAASEIRNERYISVIDYRAPSNVPRYFLIDTADMSAATYLVAHGRGSDPDHDGTADRFSNIKGSRMTSLGAYATGKIYYGAHGLSLKLHGLSPQNSNAKERLIVIHGADYVNKDHRIIGRSWGCPALESDVAKRLIPLIKGGSFLYVVGTPANMSTPRITP